MTSEDVTERVIEQFSDRGDRADIWRALDLVLPTDRFLNIGYSGRYQSHLVGAPQSRLAKEVSAELRVTGARHDHGRLLDLGCGRGGAAAFMAERFELDVIGVDLVPNNLGLAKRLDTDDGPVPSFLVGDAVQLPFADRAFSHCTSIDAIVYMPDVHGVFREISRVLRPAGICVVSDLLATSQSALDDPTLQQFSQAWDMPPIRTEERYLDAIEAAGLEIHHIRDLSPHSVDRFRKWTSLFLWLADGPLGDLLDTLLSRRGIDPEAVLTQVRAAHEALPSLRHVLVTMRGPSR